MKILVATNKTQGKRKNDFCWVPEGEPVKQCAVCDADRERGPDGGCGCNRALAGMNSHKGTTTVVVAERDVTLEDLVQMLTISEREAGWIRGEPDEQERRILQEQAEWIVEHAGRYDVGTVLEYRSGVFGVRSRPS